ncbi:hypothetical protein AN958_09296, partial [Leucoagaricus sp. SymC.cos]
EGIVHVLKITCSYHLITTRTTLPAGLLDGIQELSSGGNEYEPQIQEMPPLSHTFPKLGNEKESDAFDSCPPPVQAPAPSDLALYLHSSGSTRLPKATVPQTHRRMCQWANVSKPEVEEANKVTPNYSCLFKDMILITTSDKPLPRAPEGTVIRKKALHAYAGEIEAM